jgi:hypothetical protein
VVNQFTIDKNITRICYSCGTNKTRLNGEGRPSWILNLPTKLILCQDCYYKIVRNPIFKSQGGYKRYYRFGSTIQLLANKRELTGYCSKCSNNIHDKSCRVTHMHHWIYIIIFTWFGREELCASCHAKETWQGWQCMKLRVRK